MKVGVRSWPAPVKYVKQINGFTIVETMVVLTVTGALFVAIAASLTGRQNAAEFTHSIQSVQSQLQQVINQVPDGNFPDKNVSCASGGSSLVFSGGGNQGTNSECLFLGKVIQFHVHNAGGLTTEQYQVYTIAGLNTQGTAASPFAAAKPTVVQVGSNIANYSTAISLEYGLQVVWMRSNNNLSCFALSCSIGAVGFLMEPGQAGNTGTGYSSGAQQVDLIPIRTTGLNQDLSTTVIKIQDSTTGSGGLQDVNLLTVAPINPTSGVQICFASGTTNQSGLVTIGSTGRQLAVKLNVKSGNMLCQ
jgi:type II secretory pathway pseudopilin PulG